MTELEMAAFIFDKAFREKQSELTKLDYRITEEIFLSDNYKLLRECLITAISKNISQFIKK